MQVNFFEFLQVVHESLERDGPQCNIAWKEAITDIEYIIDRPNDLKMLEGKRT